MPPKNFYSRLVYLRQKPFVGALAYALLKLLGVEIPRSVPIGDDLELAHGALGSVIHSRARLGSRIKLFSGVTLGRADVYRSAARSRFEGIVIEDDVVLGSGCKVLCSEGVLYVRRGTVIGANAVLLQSTGEWEIWAGIPARCVGKRDPQDLP